MAKRKSGNRRQDHYSREAQKRGYSARSVFKFEEIQQKHRIVKPGAAVLDLGAAPGSWTAFLATTVGESGAVVAVDLAPLKPARPLPPWVSEITGDFTDPETIDRISGAAPFDAVVSDAAPSTSGNRLVDTARSAALVESIEALLNRWLKPSGNLVVKLFQGGQEQEIEKRLRGRFESIKWHRPKAVRSESFEIYIVGLGFRQKETGPADVAR